MRNLVVVIFLIVSNNLFSQTLNLKNLDGYLTHIENNNLGVGSVSIFKGGKEVYNRSYGQKNIPHLIYNSNTKYEVGSVTKMINATLIFKLIEKGNLRLDDLLSQFYPDIKNANKITIRNLLDHTSGLGSYVVKNGEIWVTEKVTEKEIFDLINEQGVSFEPNEKVAYSNTAYYLLTKILEKKYKKPFHEIVENEIVKPLKLKNLTSIKSNPKNVFAPYHFEENKWKELEKEINLLNVIGVGDISSTTKDLNIFINNLFQHKIISVEILEKMLPVVGKEEWGRGISIWEFDGKIFYGHGGDTIGTHTLVIYNKEDDFSIAYSSNAERINKQEFVQNVFYSLYNKDFKFPETN